MNVLSPSYLDNEIMCAYELISYIFKKDCLLFSQLPTISAMDNN